MLRRHISERYRSVYPVVPSACTDLLVLASLRINLEWTHERTWMSRMHEYQPGKHEDEKINVLDFLRQLEQMGDGEGAHVVNAAPHNVRGSQDDVHASIVPDALEAGACASATSSSAACSDKTNVMPISCTGTLRSNALELFRQTFYKVI